MKTGSYSFASDATLVLKFQKSPGLVVESGQHQDTWTSEGIKEFVTRLGFLSYKVVTREKAKRFLIINEVRQILFNHYTCICGYTQQV